MAFSAFVIKSYIKIIELENKFYDKNESQHEGV